MEINELRRLYQLGQISGAELEQAESQNVLRDMLMPQPRYDVAPMQNNTMRTESGPMAGNVVNMDFAKPGPAAPKLGAEVEVAGLGRGRYSADGRSVVLPDGRVHDMFPERTKRMEEEKFVRADRANKLSMADILKRKGEADLEQTKAQTAALTAKPVIEPGSQPALEKKYGKAEKGKRWTLDGRLEQIPGSEGAGQNDEALTGAAETIRKIDAMIGRRNPDGSLAEGSKPHAGFEDLIGATYKPFARLLDGTDAADMQARLDEIKGGAFLKAFESLKGGGQITEVEGKKATDAITRMSRSQSEAEFVQAALEFRNVVEIGLQRAAAKGGAQPQQSGVKRISSEQEWAALPSGTQYIGPDGQTRTKR